MTSVKIERRERRQHRQVATSDVDDSDDDARICEYMRKGRKSRDPPTSRAANRSAASPVTSAGISTATRPRYSPVDRRLTRVVRSA